METSEGFLPSLCRI